MSVKKPSHLFLCLKFCTLTLSICLLVFRFWRALRSFDQTDRAKFLQFVTGSSKVPLQVNNNFYCTCCLYSAGRNDFDAGSINYEGHWKGWALKSRLFVSFVGSEMATSPTKVEVIGQKTFLRRYKSLFETLEIRLTCKTRSISLLLDTGGQKMAHKSR